MMSTRPMAAEIRNPAFCRGLSWRVLTGKNNMSPKATTRAPRPLRESVAITAATWIANPI